MVLLVACAALSSCGLVNSAGSAAQGVGGLLMSPLRLLQGTLGEEDSAPGRSVGEQELLRRADEIQRRGLHQPVHKNLVPEGEAPAMAHLQP